MAISEFDIIGRYFAGRHRRPDVVAAIGDDCALLQPPSGMELAVTTDTLIEGVHFPVDTAPAAVGHKVLAVSLSDLAAMGATPAWAVLSLSLPEAEPHWLEPFAAGLFALAEAHDVDVVGGDTVRGPRVLTLQAMGLVPAGTALRRSGARPGDRIYVTGTLGDAGLGLETALGRLSPPPACRAMGLERLDRPQPRVREGNALRGIATSCIDISDGLAADLGHILDASGVGATVDVDALSLSECLRDALGADGAVRAALSAGDDYELCFTVPPDRCSDLEQRFAAFECRCLAVGEIAAQPGLRFERGGRPYKPAQAGYDHFGGGGSDE